MHLKVKYGMPSTRTIKIFAINIELMIQLLYFASVILQLKWKTSQIHGKMGWLLMQSFTDTGQLIITLTHFILFYRNISFFFFEKKKK